MTAPLLPERCVRVGVVGARGNMGRRVVALLEAAAPRPWAHAGGSCLQLAATLQRARIEAGPTAAPAARVPAATPGVLHTDCPQAFAAHIDLAIDFSAPAAAVTLAPVLAHHNVPYLVASTGLSQEATDALAQASTRAAILLAANTSLGVHVLGQLVRQACAMWPQGDVEVLEAHHRRKRDAPSGTALWLGAQVQRGRADVGATPLQAQFGRGETSSRRAAHALGYSALRGGDVVGEHTVFLFGEGERIELVHRCSDANTFAQGALVAGQWLSAQPAGHYAMADVLRAAR